jgi:predicted nucleotidyltransferase
MDWDTLVPLDQLIREKREEIRDVAARHGVTSIRVFGSVARGEAGANSDLDLLIETGPQTSSWFPAGLIIDLEALLGCRVDVVTEAGLRPELRELVLKDARPL